MKYIRMIPCLLLGHKWGKWIYFNTPSLPAIARWSECERCGHTQYKDVTSQ